MLIKNCPHCGGRATLRANKSPKTHGYFVSITCTVCGAQSKAFYTERNPERDDWQSEACLDAVGAWNMRVNEE